jgi:Tol biopolymer transport system component
LPSTATSAANRAARSAYAIQSGTRGSVPRSRSSHEDAAHVLSARKGLRVLHGDLTAGRQHCARNRDKGNKGFAMRTIAAFALLALAAVLGVAGAADAAWPGDNGRIAFVRSEGFLGGDIYSMAPDGSDLKKLTDTGFESDPVWSPDGEWLAFTSRREAIPGVYVMRADGSGLRRVTGGSEPSWSSDGRQLAFVSPPPPADGTATTLTTIHVDGSNRRDVFQSSATIGSFQDPEWSPDGRRVAFTAVWRAPSTWRVDVLVVNLDGTGLQRAFPPLNGAPDPTTSSPSWSPTGDLLAASGRTFASDGIYVGPVGGAALKVSDLAGSPGWSPDGSRIVFERPVDRSSGGLEIYSMRADGSDLARLTVNSLRSTTPDWQRRPGSAPPPGLTRLPSGVLSIPAASVAPAKLVLSAVRMSPWPRRPGSPLSVRLVLRDSRGFVVRGATVSVRSSPARRLVRALPARTRPDGSAAVWVDPRGKARSLVVYVTARVPGAVVTGRYAVRPG